MGDRCGMSISADSPSDETLNRGPLALLLRRQYEFPFGINIVQFSFFIFISMVNDIYWSFFGAIINCSVTQFARLLLSIVNEMRIYSVLVL